MERRRQKDTSENRPTIRQMELKTREEERVKERRQVIPGASRDQIEWRLVPSLLFWRKFVVK